MNIFGRPVIFALAHMTAPETHHLTFGPFNLLNAHVALNFQSSGGRRVSIGFLLHAVVLPVMSGNG
jgi:hypothetical protein